MTAGPYLSFAINKKDQKKHMLKHIVIVGFLCLGMTSLSLHAGEAALFGKKKTEAPVFPIHDDATFAEKTKTFDVPLFDQAELEYVINLPPEWKMENLAELPSQQSTTATLSQSLLGDVTRFKSPFIGTSQAMVTVQVLQLDHEITAENWLKNHIIISGYAPDGKIKAVNNARAHAAFFYTQNAVSFYTQAAVQISGNHILLVRFDVPVNLKEPLAFLQRKAIESFKLLYPKDGPVEEQLTFTMADAVKFNYPQSWDTTGSNLKDLNRLNVRLNNRDAAGALQGLIQTTAVRRTRSTKIVDEILAVKKYFGDLGFKVTGMKSSASANVSKRFIFNRYETYTIQKEGQNVQELHVVMLGDSAWYVITYMVTPQEADNIYTWARNTRTFDLLVQSIK